MIQGANRNLARSAPQRSYANNLRSRVTQDFVRRRRHVGLESEVKSVCANVEMVELYLKDNTKAHHTSKFELASEALLLRRGQPFYLAVRLNREYKPKKDTIRFIAECGPTPHVTKGTKGVMLLEPGRAHTVSKPGMWDAVISRVEESDITLKIEAPVTCPIGIWHFIIQTGLTNSPNEVRDFRVEEDIYILLNPYNKGDSVYLSQESEIREYVENDTGKVWMGSYRQPRGRRWIFGQYEDVVLPTVMYLLELADLPHEDRGSPVLISRAISAVINAADEGGLVIGRWDGDYRDGTSPHAWTGSAQIMEQYLRSGATPVPYGQCWVFSALVVTACRAIGMPCRSVTNYVSAHDTNSSLTVDKYFDANGEEIIGGPDGECHDSCWNFHVWNDVWMSRPDLPQGYGGWQIIDATPQEMSGNMMRCGPASVEAVKSGQVGYTYDTPFVFSEVNADVCHFKEDPSSSWGFTRLKMNQYHVGRKIVTKRVGLDDDIGDADVWDVTYFYKNPEGSREERMAVFNAVKGVDKAQKMYNFPTVAQQDVGFDLVEIDSKNFGQEFSIVVNIENRSAKERNIDAILTASSVFYTGATVHRLKRAHGQFKIQPHGKETLRLRVSPVDYADKLVDHSLIKIHAIASVLETRQTWSEEDDFPLLKPHMNVEIRGERRVGQGCTATFSFTNTIGRELTHCKLSIEGPGLQWPKVIKCRDISPGEVYSYTESFHPRRPGETKIVATFTSKQLVDVIGSATVMVNN
ncbi:hemocyte protein-glutamine gamma-glutamyltransferase-like [Rhodnius prolixus]|uniref:hemocyte protein-glutamine gamma-glutamyltransferase-like n=1 Tax=Rhodnius prolixus TaxID=13249 RepID=UPI003D18CA8D